MAQPRIRVLVVDDHRMFAQSLVRILADESDIEIVGVASTVNEARAVASGEPADVVLLDYELPDTLCLLSSHDVASSVMKNCPPFVLGPALAIDRMPALV